MWRFLERSLLVLAQQQPGQAQCLHACVHTCLGRLLSNFLKTHGTCPAAGVVHEGKVEDYVFSRQEQGCVCLQAPRNISCCHNNLNASQKPMHPFSAWKGIVSSQGYGFLMVFPKYGALGIPDSIKQHVTQQLLCATFFVSFCSVAVGVSGLR